MFRIASYNVENLFSRPKAFTQETWNAGMPILRAYRKVNALFAKPVYSAADKQEMRDLLVVLDIYFRNEQGAIRRRRTDDPKWAWFRKNRGQFDRQPSDDTNDVEIVAEKREDWIGWVELAREPADEIGIWMTGRVIADVAADVIGMVEAEDRPSLKRFNEDFIGNFYDHVMLIDGNDDRGIDVGIMTRAGFDIVSIRSNVDLEDAVGEVFSRDCSQYEIRTPGGAVIHVLVNHFKSQAGGGGAKRQRQATAVRGIVDALVAQGKHVVVLGDMNEGSAAVGESPANLGPLFDPNGPLVNSYTLAGFDVGNRPGTFDSCGIRNRLDYVLLSKSLAPSFHAGGVFRKGLWGSRKTRPTDWQTYPEMTNSSEQASDHAAIFIDINL